MNINKINGGIKKIPEVKNGKEKPSSTKSAESVKYAQAPSSTKWFSGCADLSNTAKSFEEKGDYEKAISTYQEATKAPGLSTDSCYYNAQFQIAWIYETAQQNYKKAIAEYGEIIKKDEAEKKHLEKLKEPSSTTPSPGPSTSIPIGKKKEKTECKWLFKEITDQAQYRIAQIYQFNLKDHKKAIQEYKNLIKKCPKSAYVEDAKAQIKILSK